MNQKSQFNIIIPISIPINTIASLQFLNLLKMAKLAQRAKKVKVHLKPLLHQAFSNLT